MIRNATAGVFLIVAIACEVAGCGALYQAHTEFRSQRMINSLQTGQSSLEVHNKWGEPDIRTDMGEHNQLWSYAERPNSNDVTAALLYTAPKPGDKGRFLDLNFVDGKLASWAEADHTMPPKEASGFSYGIGNPTMGQPTMHY